MSWGEGEPEQERIYEFPCKLCGHSTDNTRRIKGEKHPLQICYGCDSIYNEKEIIDLLKLPEKARNEKALIAYRSHKIKEAEKKCKEYGRKINVYTKHPVYKDPKRAIFHREWGNEVKFSKDLISLEDFKKEIIEEVKKLLADGKLN